MALRITTLILAGVLSVGASGGADSLPTLNYYLGRDVVVVDLTTTVTTTRRIVDTTVADDCTVRHGKPDAKGVMQPVAHELCVTDKDPTTVREGGAQLKLVPVLKLGVPLNSSSGVMTDDQQTVQLRDGMMLDSINVSSIGRAGDVLMSIGKFAGVLLGGLSPFNRAAALPPTVLTVSSCDPFDPRYKDLPDTARLWIWENARACEQWKQIVKLDEARKARIDDRTALEKEIRGATPAELKQIYAHLDGINDAVDRLDTELKAFREAFDKPFAAFSDGLHLGAVSETSHHNRVLELTDLTPGAGFDVGMNAAQVDDQLKKAGASDVVTKLWAASRLLITLDSSLPAKCAEVSSVPANPDDKKYVQIAFRQGTPARVRVMILDQQRLDGDKPDEPVPQRLRVAADQWENVVHPCTPVGATLFSRSAWAKREISFTFDDKGRPQKVERVSGSTALALATSLSGAATNLRDELAATMSKATQVESDRRTLELNDLTTRLERLKKEKDVFDAQLQLDSAGANRETSLKQQQATAEMAQLQAEISLKAAQDMKDQATELDRVKTALELLKQQLELLKAQQALQAANKEGGV
jgi:hypothetical protein